MSDLHEKALALYTPPFRYEHGYIFDSLNQMVADHLGLDADDPNQTSTARIRGWGRISYMDNPEQLQDTVGDIVAKALTEYYANHKKDQPSLPSTLTAERD